MVGRNDAAQIIHRAHAVAVTVERDAKGNIALASQYRRLQIGQIGGHCGVRVVIGELAVAVEIEFGLLGFGALEQRFEHNTGHAVACVPCDVQIIERSCFTQCLFQLEHIFIEHIDLFAFALR